MMINRYIGDRLVEEENLKNVVVTNRNIVEVVAHIKKRINNGV